MTRRNKSWSVLIGLVLVFRIMFEANTEENKSHWYDLYQLINPNLTLIIRWIVYRRTHILYLTVINDFTAEAIRTNMFVFWSYCTSSDFVFKVKSFWTRVSKIFEFRLIFSQIKIKKLPQKRYNNIVFVSTRFGGYCYNEKLIPN